MSQNDNQQLAQQQKKKRYEAFSAVKACIFGLMFTVLLNGALGDKFKVYIHLTYDVILSNLCQRE